MPYKNKEDQLAQRRRYYREHRQEFLDRMKRYYANNREKVQVYLREYQKQHREEARLYGIEYRKTHPDKRKRGDYNYFRRLKAVRGLTKQHYDALFAHQNGVCAICRRTTTRKLHVDHDHNTQAVRGLLCSYCNTGLGMIERVGPGPILTYLQKTDEERKRDLCQN